MSECAPIHTEVAITETTPWHRRQLARAGLALVTMLGPASCTGVADDFVPPEVPAVSAEAMPEVPYTFESVCRAEDMASNVQRRQAASEYCINAMDNGRVALVVTGRPAAFELVAGGLERFVDKASDGMVQVEVDVVGVPMEVASAFNEGLGKEGCIDAFDSWLSTTAGRLMAQELAEYHAIVGMSEFGRCDASAVGSAWGRYAEVFYVDLRQPGYELERIVAVTGHELFHLYALNHTGAARNPDGFYPELGTPFDLLAHLRASEYTEYIPGTDVMGNPGGLEASLNGLHLDQLARYRASVEGDEVLLSRPIGTGWRTFTAEDAQNNQFTRAELTAPVVLSYTHKKAGEEHEVVREFTELALVPVAYEGTLETIHLYLTNQDGFVVSVGGVPVRTDTPGVTYTYEFTLNGETITIDYSTAGARIRKTSVADCAPACIE